MNTGLRVNITIYASAAPIDTWDKSINIAISQQKVKHSQNTIHGSVFAENDFRRMKDKQGEKIRYKCRGLNKWREKMFSGKNIFFVINSNVRKRWIK